MMGSANRKSGNWAIPPHFWFGLSAAFRYLGPSFAVLLFSSLSVPGVALLRIGSAAAIFAAFARPLDVIRKATARSRVLIIGLGICIALMNCAFYFALERLPLSLVATIEFVGTIGVALYGLRTLRNFVALSMAAAGVFVLINLRLGTDALGLIWAFLNGIFFVLYILLGHRVANFGDANRFELLSAAMMISCIAVFPFGILQAIDAFRDPLIIMAGMGIGICSSVIPYVCDQLAMARLPRATFALFLALLPASATIIGALVLTQIPTLRELAGIVLVMAGVALHQQRD